jgi:rod shape-determining protein MreD
MKKPPNTLKLLNFAIIVGSIVICVFLTGRRLPGTELAGIEPNWLLIWLVSWCLRGGIWNGLFAGLAVGWLQEAIIGGESRAAISFVIVGVLTACFSKQRFLREDFITIALVVFGMTLISETVIAARQYLLNLRDREDLWFDYQRITLTAAIISSLWAPVLHYPLQSWFRKYRDLYED